MSEHQQRGFAQLAELTALHAKISTAYILKETFRHIYAVATNARSAALLIRRWCALVEESWIDPLKRSRSFRKLSVSAVYETRGEALIITC